MHRSQSATTSRLGRRRSSLGDTSRAKTGISSTPISMKVDDMNSQGTPPTEESSTHSDDDMPHFSRPAQSSLNVQKRNLQRRLSRRNSADAPGLDNKSPQGKERTDTDTERPARPARIALNAQKQAMERRMARRNSVGADIPSQISKYSASRISQRGSEVEEGEDEPAFDSNMLVPTIPSVDHANTSSLDTKPKKERRSSLSGLHSFQLELRSKPSSEMRRERRRASMADAMCTDSSSKHVLPDWNTAKGRRRSDGDGPNGPSRLSQPPMSSIYRGSSYSCLESLANESSNTQSESKRSKSKRAGKKFHSAAMCGKPCHTKKERNGREKSKVGFAALAFCSVSSPRLPRALVLLLLLHVLDGRFYWFLLPYRSLNVVRVSHSQVSS